MDSFIGEGIEDPTPNSKIQVGEGDKDNSHERQADDEHVSKLERLIDKKVATAFLTYEHIAACVDPSLTVCDSVTALSRDPRELFVGVDVGRFRDLTVMWVVARGAKTSLVVPPYWVKPVSGRRSSRNRWEGNPKKRVKAE